MIDEAQDADFARCGCERPLRSGETLCPRCERSASAWWKVPVKVGASLVAGAVGVAVVGVVSAVLGGKPRA